MKHLSDIVGHRPYCETRLFKWKGAEATLETLKNTDGVCQECLEKARKIEMKPIYIRTIPCVLSVYPDGSARLEGELKDGAVDVEIKLHQTGATLDLWGTGDIEKATSGIMIYQTLKEVK